MTYEYNTLDAVLSATNEERSIDRSDVNPRVLSMNIWQGMVSLQGGYMPHAHACYRSKANAVDFLVEHAEYGSGPRRPSRARLARDHVAYYEGDCYELVQMTVGELF